MTKDEKRDFYNECMDCRVTSWGCIEAEEIDEFYRLIDGYTEKQLKEKVKKITKLEKENAELKEENAELKASLEEKINFYNKQGLEKISEISRFEKENEQLKAQIEKMKAELHHRLVSPSHSDSDLLDKIISLDRLWKFGQEF